MPERRPSQHFNKKPLPKMKVPILKSAAERSANAIADLEGGLLRLQRLELILNQPYSLPHGKKLSSAEQKLYAKQLSRIISRANSSIDADMRAPQTDSAARMRAQLLARELTTLIRTINDFELKGIVDKGFRKAAGAEIE